MIDSGNSDSLVSGGLSGVGYQPNDDLGGLRRRESGTTENGEASEDTSQEEDDELLLEGIIGGDVVAAVNSGVDLQHLSSDINMIGAETGGGGSSGGGIAAVG